ncbi:MAG: DNA polymerase III subunit gamma/tau [Proteobacteria bacterium]|nr:DNA polymerase III subunit gamma/tau [Pseudomonadota bacterium]
MSYQVLARKWRPKKFSELVGQEHVVRALSNALDSQRMHHAFLFTGTRGIGKTTIARIFAKALNCERGQSSNPCGECATCRDIDAGRFMDMIEIDAASNTGVDDVRQLIENAQYSPARGRFKVYLIDEVHMLSKSAFNALLKTLEEPPAHVKFLLATTDPEKLPVTVLSRCLKFNLKRLLPDQIVHQMRHILEAERIAFDAGALEELARGADGSLRDGLSLLDQAIAHGAGTVSAAEVRQMLGTLERGEVFALIESVHAGDGAKLLAQIEHLAEFAPDFAGVLDDLAAALHRVQIAQIIGAADSDARIAALAEALTAEETQLYYQIATTGRRDLPIAPTTRAGFEMTLLRMLAFRPADAKPGNPTTLANSAAPAARSPAAVPRAGAARPASPPLAGREAPAANAAAQQAATAGDWPALIAAAGVRGPAGQLAQHAALLGVEGDIVRLELTSDHEHLRAPMLVAQLQESLGRALGAAITLRFEKALAAPRQTPADIARGQRSARQQAAAAAMDADPVVQGMIRDFGARVIPESIKATEK